MCYNITGTVLDLASAKYGKQAAKNEIANEKLTKKYPLKNRNNSRVEIETSSFIFSCARRRLHNMKLFGVHSPLEQALPTGRWHIHVVPLLLLVLQIKSNIHNLLKFFEYDRELSYLLV